jgi:hypothetical protein
LAGECGKEAVAGSHLAEIVCNGWRAASLTSAFGDPVAGAEEIGVEAVFLGAG